MKTLCKKIVIDTVRIVTLILFYRSYNIHMYDRYNMGTKTFFAIYYC